MMLLIFSTSVSRTAHAEDVTWISKGSQSPYSGVLFPEAKAKELRIEILEGEKFKVINESLQRNNEAYKEALDLSRSNTKVLREQNEKLINAQNHNGFEKALWFGLGVLATSLAVYGAASLAR